MGGASRLAIGMAAAIVLAGCGSTSHQQATTTSVAASPNVALPAGPPPAAIKGRVLTVGELAGYAPGKTHFTNSAAGEVADLPISEQGPEAARLQSLGFVAALREQLTPVSTGSSEGEAISIAEQFRSPRAARTQLAFIVGHDTGGAFTPFVVPGIPGAHGWAESSQGGAINIAFADGPYYYIVGAGWQPGQPQPPTQSTMIAATQRLYSRVHR